MPEQNSLPDALEYEREMQALPILVSDDQHSEPSETFPGEPMPASHDTGKNETPARQPSALLQENMDRMAHDAPALFSDQFSGQEAPPGMP